MLWQYDGTSSSGAQQLSGNLSGDSLRLVAVSCGATDVTLKIKGFTGVGTYPLSAAGNAAYFRRYLPGTSRAYLASGVGAVGTVTVSSYSTARRTLMGTFSFVANRLPPAQGTVAVTGGIFDLTF